MADDKAAKEFRSAEETGKSFHGRESFAHSLIHIAM
jgi:hypothetical protein